MRQDLVSGETLPVPKVGQTLPTAPVSRVDQILSPPHGGFSLTRSPNEPGIGLSNRESAWPRER